MPMNVPLGITLEDLDASIARDEGKADPVYWLQDMNQFAWSKQREIMESVRDNRYTAVPACHGPGKSWLAAWLTIWWLSVHTIGEALVVTTATTTRQVRDILWKEIGRAHGISNMPGRTNQMELILPNPRTGKEEILGLGMKPADMDEVAFSGRHERFVLIIGDEAGGLHKNIIDGTGNLMTNEHCRQLLIGNPDDPTAEFANLCAPVSAIPNGSYTSDSGYRVIPISVFDTPNFTGEDIPGHLKDLLVSKIWVEEKTRKWGISSPMYKSKIKGEFPDIATDKLIPLPWIIAAQQRTLDPGDTRELGVDVGRGGDESTYCLRKGPVARVIDHDRIPNVMKVADKVHTHMDTHLCQRAKVDSIGIGAGVVDKSHEVGKVNVHGVNVGGGARNKKNFGNLRAEGYWELRQLFEDGDIDIDPEDEELAAELSNLDYDSSSGKIYIKSKEQMRREGTPSPNRAESLMLAFISPYRIKPGPLTWGTKITYSQGNN